MLSKSKTSRKHPSEPKVMSRSLKKRYPRKNKKKKAILSNKDKTKMRSADYNSQISNCKNRLKTKG